MRLNKRLFAGVLAVIIIFSMVGSVILGYFAGGIPKQDTTAAASSGSDFNTTELVNALKAQLSDLKNQEKKTPDDFDLLAAMGDVNHQLGVAMMESSPTEGYDYLKNAISSYQKALEKKKDKNVMLSLAIAAFNARDDQLAEQSFQEALKEDKDFFPALYYYGMLLFEKGDSEGAIREWEKALPLSPSDTDTEQLQNFISEARTKLQAAGQTDSKASKKN